MARIRILMLGVLCVASVHAGEVQNDLRAGVVFGYDSNPLKIAGEGEGEAYSQLRAEAGFDWKLGAGWAWFGDVEARSRLHGSSASNADKSDGGLQAGLSWQPGRRVLVKAGASWAAYRATFTDRADGGVYVVEGTPPTDPATLVEIPDRFSFDTSGAFGRLRVKAGKRVRLSLDLDVNDTEYVTDYSDATGLAPLDFSALAVEPGFSVRVSPSVAFRVTSSWVSLDYDYLPALDSAGDEIPGETREYRYLSHRVVLAFDPVPGWDFKLGLSAADRSDEAAGYYDYASLGAYVSAWRALGERSRLGFYMSGRNLDYDSATVFGDPDSELRASDLRRYSARFERRFGESLRWFAEGGSQSTDNSDPLFVYDRRWFATGIDYRR